MTDIGLINSNGEYRVLVLNTDDILTPLKPRGNADDEPDNLLGIVNSNGDYREIDYGSDEQVVELRPSENHQWQGGKWVYVDPPRDIEAEVHAHAIALKVGIVNATNKQGVTYPATQEGLTQIIDHFSQTAASINTKGTKFANGRGDEPTAEEWDTLDRIEAGFKFFTSVDAALAVILESGSAADPINTDERWPQLPTGA